ncbi:DNA repair protein RecO [Candidatus Pelagibacter sp.]|nr:DNA repair protein RecO [Candidatus Pelagibacter sp.]
MNWDDTGFLVSKNRYNENSMISEFYTENHGKVSAIIFGATSKKVKNYLQIGNKLYLNHTYKNEGKIGYFKVEILKAYTPEYFDNKKKLMCIASAMNLIKILTVESQENLKIFKLIENFFKTLQSDDWIKEYIFWELELLKLIGYDLQLQNIVDQEEINNTTVYFVKSSTEKKIVPNFLIDKKNNNLDNLDLFKGLKLVGDYLDKNILRPNNIIFPTTRLDFINMLK